MTQYGTPARLTLVLKGFDHSESETSFVKDTQVPSVPFIGMCLRNQENPDPVLFTVHRATLVVTQEGFLWDLRHPSIHADGTEVTARLPEKLLAAGWRIETP